MKPCHQCPFRRKGLPGYLGPHKESKEITDFIESDQKYPCHVSVETISLNLYHEHEFDEKAYDENIAEAIAAATPCVGSMQFIRNRMKLSRDPELAKQQLEAGPNPDVFNSLDEMKKFHGK